MRSLYALLLLSVAAAVLFASPVWGGERYGVSAGATFLGTMAYDPGYEVDWLMPTSWRYDRDRFYDRFERRRDFRHFYGDRHFSDRHYRDKRHFWGKRHYRTYPYSYSPYRPYRFYGKGHYRSYDGGHLHFSGCFRSGGVTLCFNR